MRIEKLCYHPSFCNTYVLGEEGEPCLLIDPGYNGNDVLGRYISKHHGRKILGIVLTHGHFDHFFGLQTLKVPEGTPVFLSEEDYPCLTDPKKNASFDLAEPFSLRKEICPYFLEEGDETSIGVFFFRTIATPFHTKGSLCLYFEREGALFSGDTLFKMGIGRDDLPHASPREKERSLRKIFALPSLTVVYPGHGPKTSIGDEKRNLDGYLF